MEQLNRWFRDAYDTALGWLSSPAALSQFGILIAAYILARLLARRFSPAVERTLTPKPESTHILARLRRFALVFLPGSRLQISHACHSSATRVMHALDRTVVQ